MPTRITVRYLGSEVGKKVARPDTKGELLELAAKRLNLSTPALRVFAEGGDEYDGDEDVVLIESDEIIYVSCGEDFGSTAPTGAPSAPACCCCSSSNSSYCASARRPAAASRERDEHARRRGVRCAE